MKYEISPKTDRRILKTKKALTEALIHLILEKGYEQVTIQEIIDKANVGRSTFYFHYESKEQLLEDGPNNMNVDLFLDSVKDTENSYGNIFNHISVHIVLARAMIGKREGGLMVQFFRNNLSRQIKNRNKINYGKTKAEQKMLSYLSDACASAIVSIIISWINDDIFFTNQEMAFKCQQMELSVFAKEMM